MISNRTLMKWRREALIVKDSMKGSSGDEMQETVRFQVRDYLDKVLRMTQELLDQNLKEGGIR